MRRGLARGSFGAALVLCLISLAACDSAFAQEPGRVANAFWIEGANWPVTSVSVRATTETATVRLTDCKASAAFTASLKYGQTAFVEDFGTANLCNQGVTLSDGTRVGVAMLKVESGDADFTSESVFRDPRGIVNVVSIDELPEPIGLELEYRSSYVFDNVRNGYDKKLKLPRGAWIALIAENGGYARARIELLNPDQTPLLDQAMNPVVEKVDVDGFRFYRLETPIDIGTIVVSPSLLPAASRFWAVVLTGFEEGSPVAIVPRVVTSPAV